MTTDRTSAAINCTCDGCSECDGHEPDCTCDVDWEALYGSEAADG